MDDPKVEKHLRMLNAMPRDFRELAEYGWTRLRPELYEQAIKHGATPVDARVIAARLARLVVSQMYGDIMRARTMPTNPT
jgi:hypothetical protein